MKAFHLIIGAVCLCAFMLTACSSDGGKTPDAPETETLPVDTLYNQANDALEAGNHIEAARLFEEVERQHPYSQWATKAEMMAAYSYYKDMRYDEAIIALERFIELHPGNDDVDYAYYLKALSFYEQISDVARDQAMTKEALAALETLIRRFPDSQYARDASYKRDLALDHLAGKEMEIGRYYLNRGQINAAIGRFRTVVKDYQTTTHVPEALHRLVEAYTTLGLRQEAFKVAAVLGHNYPGSQWYEKTYSVMDDRQRQKLMEDRDFMDRAVDVLFKPD